MNNNFLPYQLKKTNDTNESLATQLAEKVQQGDLVVSVKEKGAVGDGVHDDTSAFQSAIDSLPSSGGRILVPKGVYIVNYIQTGTKNIVIEGAGIGATIIKRNSNVRVIYANGDGTNFLEIRNLKIDGMQYESAGVRAGNLYRISIIDSEVSNCGVVTPANGHERGSIDGVYCPNVQYGFFVRSHFNYNERDGVLGYPVVHMTVKDCVFLGNGRFPSANQQEDTNTYGPLTSTFENNYAYDCKSGGFDAETNTALAPCHSIFNNNRIIDCGNDDVGYSWGITLGINSYGEVTNNYISGLAKTGVNSAYKSGITATGNKGPLLIKGNRVVGSGRHGIYVGSTNTEVIIEDNIVTDNAECGIFAYSSPDVIIANNIVKNNQQHGIRLNLSAQAVVKGNTVKGNSQAGSGLYSGIKTELSYNLIISNNAISGNLHNYGVELDSESYTVSLTMVGNMIKDTVTKWFNWAGDTVSGDVFNGKKVLTGAHLPFNGKYRVGDIIDNNTPTPSGYKGWMCTTAGTIANNAWTASTAYTVGTIRYANNKVYTCTVAGTSGTTAPSHTSGTATDGTVTWQYTDILAVLKGFGTLQA